jgi:hypothetical protein
MPESHVPKSAFDLLALAERRFACFCAEARIEDFLLLTFLLAHLREWIVKGQKFEEIQELKSERWTPGQAFFMELRNVDAFKKVKAVCNGTKHYVTKSHVAETDGSRVGLSRAGDRLGQKYFLIDGADARGLFQKVMSEYRDFFEALRATEESNGELEGAPETQHGPE